MNALTSMTVPVSVSAVPVPPTATPPPGTADKVPWATVNVAVTGLPPASTSPNTMPVTGDGTSSTTPIAAGAATVGASLTGRTSTLRFATLVAVPPPASELIARTVRGKSAAPLAGGVTVRAARFHPVISTSWLPAAAVKLLIPSARIAPTGSASSSSESDSEPSVSTSATPMAGAIAVSSLPAAGATASAGASATGSTVTARFAETVALKPFAASVLVALTVRLKLASLCAGGRTLRVARFQAVTSTTWLPALAVKLASPSDNVAPTGIVETPSASVSEPSVSTSDAVTASGIAVSSFPTARFAVSEGASANGVTPIVKACTGEASSPPFSVPPESVTNRVTVAAPEASAASV